MYHIKQDQRSLRSAETLYDALATLITTQPFETIKISEMVAQAQVGRATFYRNFDAPEDVLRWRCDQIMEAFVAYLAEYRRSQPLDSSAPVIKPLLRFFYLHSTVVELLIAAQRSDILQKAFEEMIVQRRALLTTLPDIPAEFLAYGPVIRSSVAVNVLVHWVKGGKREAPDALADGLAEMMQNMSRMNRLV